MPGIELYRDSQHINVLFDESEDNGAVQANNHVIVHNGQAMLLDPGGHKAFRKLLSDVSSVVQVANIRHLFLSHQDPDIVAAINGWLMSTDATAWASKLWKRFIPHFGLDHLVIDRLQEIPDEGMFIDLGGLELMLVPAHFLHSAGNFQVYDPVSNILYTGDLGASIGQGYVEVPDFDAHIPHMLGFHQRYMTSSRALCAWAEMVSGLDIETIAPQHGAYMKGKAMVGRFLDWCRDLPCGVDLAGSFYRLPSKGA